MFKLEFHTDECPTWREELDIVDILRSVATEVYGKMIERMDEKRDFESYGGPVRDRNGNTIGAWSLDNG